MANSAAINAVGTAILRLLENAYSNAGFSQKANFKLYQATDLQTVPDFSNNEMGFSLFLYRIGIDGTHRNLSYNMSADGSHHNPALPLILYFMLTPWAAKADTQLWLLGWAMRVIENTPILPATLLNVPSLAIPPFRINETVELAFDPLSIQDIGMLWDTLKQPRIIPSVTYLARIIYIETDLKEEEYSPIQTREFDIPKVENE